MCKPVETGVTTGIALEQDPIVCTASAGPGNIRISFEFFPPRTKKMQKTLWGTIKRLEPLNPDFVSVTYGAGGSIRDLTHETVARIVRNTSTAVAAHLTCIGSSRDEIDKIAQDYWDAGVRHIVALRGDPEGGTDQKYTPAKGGYAYASDLISGLRKLAPFDISVSTYPEKHPENGTWDDELDNLKRKIDAGATRAITQFFLEPETFLRFRTRAEKAGIAIPIIPGIMLQPNYQGVCRMADMCKVHVPDWYHALFSGLDGDEFIRQLITAATAAELTAKLHEQGVNRFHFYTLNHADLAFTISKVLGAHALVRTRK